MFDFKNLILLIFCWLILETLRKHFSQDEFRKPIQLLYDFTQDVV